MTELESIYRLIRERFIEQDVPDILMLAGWHGWSWENHLHPLVERFGSSELEEILRDAWEKRI